MSEIPTSIAKPTDFKCMVLPPKRLNTESGVSFGMRMSLMGKPCSRSFSIGVMTRPRRCTTTKAFGVNVGVEPSQRTRARSAPWETSTTKSRPPCLATAPRKTSTCLAEVKHVAGTPKLSTPKRSEPFAFLRASTARTTWDKEASG